MGATAYSIWVIGTAVGFGVALGFPSGFDEALRLILPGYFAGLLIVEMKSWAMALVCGASLVAAVPGALASQGWGMVDYGDRHCHLGLGSGRVEISRVEIILIMGLVALGFRAVPLLFFAGRQFPEKSGPFAALRLLSHCLIQHHLDHAVHEGRALRDGRRALSRGGY